MGVLGEENTWVSCKKPNSSVVSGRYGYRQGRRSNKGSERRHNDRPANKGAAAPPISLETSLEISLEISLEMPDCVARIPCYTAAFPLTCARSQE
jgi:hypothetical protein